MSRRRRGPTAESQARADRIAAALSGLLEEPVAPAEPTTKSGGDPYRPAPVKPRPRPATGLKCPACQGAMASIYSRGVSIDRCTSCAGMWLDPGELDEMVEDTETAAVTPDLGAMRSAMSEQPGVEPISAPVKYRQCPHCNSMMNRRNFGTLSGVVIDECPRHGVFLDPDELQAIETFISLGGRELEKLSEEERMLRREKHAQRVLQDAQHTYAEARNMHRRAWFTFFGWF